MLRRRTFRQALRAPAMRIPVAGLLGIASLPSVAQDAVAAGPNGRTVSIVPTFSVLETLTDNRLLTRNDRQSDLITQLSPGVHLGSTSGRVQGQLDYSLNGFVYSRDSSQNNLQNLLNGVLKAELIENRAFIDATASISQQSISAFGTQSPDSALPNANRSEVGNYSVSPYLRGTLGGLASYEARGSYQIVHSDGFAAGNSRTNGASLSLQSERAATVRLGWQLALTHQGTSYEESRSTVSDRANATLTFAVTPELTLSASGGHESSNLASLDKEGTRTWGAGLDWRPSERTRVSLSRDTRFFGQSHFVLVEYRTPRSVWRYSDTQDATTPSATATGSTQTAYDLLFAQYASQFPDPVQRAQIVTALLANAGISRGSLVGGGFLSTAASLQRRQELSLAMTGLRTTTILTAYQTRTSNLDPLTPAAGDLATVGDLRQRGLGLTVSHRLTPNSSANASVVLLKSTAEQGDLATNQRAFTLTWTTRFNAHVNLSLSARRTWFSSTTSPYDESALIAGLNYLF